MIRRRLTLAHGGRLFLNRWGLCHERIGGFYLHHIAGPDPGMDLHDHPWSFVSIVLRGGYTELRARVFSDVHDPPVTSARRRWSVKFTGLLDAHRITLAAPGTWTLVLRGPTRRVWGFYPPDGRVEWTAYDYATRRPRSESRAGWSRWIYDGLVIESERRLEFAEMVWIRHRHESTGATAGDLDGIQWVVRPVAA